MSFLITIIVLRVLLVVAQALTREEPECPAPRRTERVFHPAEYELR